MLRFFSAETRRARNSKHSSASADLSLESAVERLRKEYVELRVLPLSESKILETVDFIQRASELRLRVPVRDASIDAVSNLKSLANSSSGSSVSAATKILSLAGQGMVYVSDLFDFVLARKASLSPQDFSLFIYECGRHGLRSKHYIDSLLADPAALRIAQDMNQQDRLRCLKGLCKFTSDYRSFISDQVEKLSLNSLSAEDTLVTMRVLRGINDARTFIRLVRKTDFNSFKLSEKFNAIYMLKRSKNFRLESRDLGAMAAACRGLVSQVAAAGEDEMRKDLIPTDLSDALDAMASLKIKNEELLEKSIKLLVEKIAEIKYSPICGLWQSITDSLGHLQSFHGAWMRIVEDLASSEFNLKSFAAFQLIFFTSSLGRLNFFSPKVFTALTNVLQTDIKSVNDPDMLGTLMFPLERAAFHCPLLVDAVITQTLTVSNRLNVVNRSSWRGILSVVYTSVSLGADSADPRIHALAKKLFAHAQPEFLSDQDFVRIARLQHVGVPCSVPAWMEESPKFALWENIERHSEMVKATLGDVQPRSDFIFCFSEDGVAQIVDSSFHNEVMNTWAHPSDERNLELTKLETTGSQRFIQRYLKTKGIEKISFVS